MTPGKAGWQGNSEQTCVSPQHVFEIAHQPWLIAHQHAQVRNTPS
jgi:hypothetical protein